MKRVAISLIFILLIPLIYSISIKEIISKYIFSTATTQMNIINHSDFMIDSNNNGVNDSLIFELTTNNTNSTFIFVINLFDKNGILTNETNKTLILGINKLNISFNSILLSQNQFNYSIKAYNSSYSLKYRKDNILTQNYSSYEEGFKILNIKDSKINKTLKINITLNSSINGTFETMLFLSYNNSFIFAKENKSVANSAHDLIFNFANETIKRTHYIGSFNISSFKIDKKIIKTNFTTAFYDFKDFAVTSYIFNFTDNGTDANNDGKYDSLQINISTQIMKADKYTIALALYDLFDGIVETKNISLFLNSGKNTISFNINGSKIYSKKLNGPFILKFIELYENITLIDRINDAYTTGNYNFNDFYAPNLPDLKVNISVSGGYRYGINNVTINFTFKNIGSKHAFNIFTEIFDNKTFLKSNKSNFLNINSQILYQFNFTNISDFEISAIADLQDFVEESNESNNAERVTIKLNKHPILAEVKNVTLNETDKITINLSANDTNGDNLSFSINLSKLSNNLNIFEWNTTTTDSGNYTLKAIVSDGFLNDSTMFKIIISDAPEKDIDNDGINDSIDMLIGNENSVNTSTINLTVFLGNSSNLSKLFNESMKVKFTDNNLTIVEFDFNFSLHKLNLTNLSINKQSANTTGSLIVRGLKMPEGATKTLYLDKINTTINGICIKEEEISAIREVSDGCNSNNEFKIECDGISQNSYICTYNSTLNKYKIQGLKHSGIIQISYANPTTESVSTSSGGSSGSGGGGGGLVCTSNWQCEEWSHCIDGFKNRKCFDLNQCAFPSKKPVELQECSAQNENKNLADIINSSNYVSGATKKIKQDASSKLSSITGRAVKSLVNEKFNFGIFIIFIEVFIIVGGYLTIKISFNRIR